MTNVVNTCFFECVDDGLSDVSNGIRNFNAGNQDVVYFDLQSVFGNSGFHFSTTGTETINLFKFLVADIPSDYPGTFNIYWAHTFKSIEEMQAFVNNENK